ncbi:MAG: fructose-bisphosphate aldolase class I [Candidatus Pacebacteria bacterium]|nr:fructose-bisphosphate aldolase class I [Candidatus Paceibacterota bacterium]MBP9840765.1 fructose-bisphosphate aldolase class I [Candidatus Paceibacterota bacterium]
MIDLCGCAKLLMAPGKGILAADESETSADKRLTAYGITPTKEMRRKYRNLFFTAPGAEKYLSGVILHLETIKQKADDKTPFLDLLTEKGIIPGIKVDEGLEPLVEGSKETITTGLLTLPDRLPPLYKAGLRFTKWRATIRIEGDKFPSTHALVENAKRLATYARMAQEAGFVPILEPEVLFEGTHSRVRAKTVLIQILKTMFHACEDQAVDISGVILKTAMALSGKESGKTDTPEEVALDTVEALMAAVPRQVPGIVFLSGGQGTEQATDNLAAIMKEAKKHKAPWPMTFSYARALQDEALTTWTGKETQVPAAQGAFLARLQKVAASLDA